MSRRVLDDLAGQRARAMVRGFPSSIEGTIVEASKVVLVFIEDGTRHRLVIPWRSIIALALQGAAR